MGSCFSKDDEKEDECQSNEEQEPDQSLPSSKSENDPIGADCDLLKPIPYEKLYCTRCMIYEDPTPPECSYCGKPNADEADMLVCSNCAISHEMFQKLMVRGWWRTGNVFFRPRIEKICCPSFAIRMLVEDHRLSKQHRRTLNRWKDFLVNGDPRWENRKMTKNMSVSDMARLHDDIGNTSKDAGESRENTTELPEEKKNSPVMGSKVKVFRKGAGPDPSKPPCKKAKERRAEKRLKNNGDGKPKVLPTGVDQVPKIKKEQTVSEILSEHEQLIKSSNPKHNLEVKLISNNDPEMVSTLPEFFNLYNRFQDAVHPGKSKFKTMADLQWGFIGSPLKPQGGTKPLGTYHMRYYLDGELIMVSLMDILPEYLVSIYFIYDPDIRFLQPGIYTCLREIALIQKLQLEQPCLRYYNLGFYNDFCPKINYKRQFKPTEILCPITGVYVPLERVIPLLKKNRFCRFAEDGVPDRPAVNDSVLDDLIILNGSGLTAEYSYYCQLPNDLKNYLKPILLHYMMEVGDDVLKEMLLSH